MYGLGERLKELREEKQISQKELSNRTGITQASIARYELNITEPKATEIKILSEFFNKTSDYILGLEMDYNTKKFKLNIQGEIQ